MKRKYAFISVILLLGLVMACGTGEEPTPEPQVAAPTEPVARTLPTPTEPVEVAEVEPQFAESVCELDSDIKTEWGTVLCETFDDNIFGWYEGFDVSDLATVDVKLNNGQYVVDVVGKPHSGYTSGVTQWFGIGSVKNFMLSVDGRIVSKNRGSTWGINFRGQGSNFYNFGIGKEGQYYLNRLQDNEWKRLINLKTAKAIKWDDAVNNLTVINDGNSMMFYVNGTLVDTYDSEQSYGDEIALFISVDEGASATYYFDNVLIRTNDF